VISTLFFGPGIEETDLIEEQVDYWNEGSSIDLQEESRYGTSIDYQNVEKHIIKDVTLLLSKIADNRFPQYLADMKTCMMWSLFVYVVEAGF
jgi:hypothetical protein